ncbi:MAG: TonB-dependent receptor [Steroidobacteraceae bacterium]|nr:TonB-dependent receptor [Steroidobacteraceae bacterium]
MMIKRKRTILEMAVATACFGAAAVMPLTAFAATKSDAAPTSTQHKKAKKRVANENLLKEVVVNGYISSIQNSIAVQKNSNSIVEAVSAEDIGKLPGTSIASALGRLPGLAMQMVSGRPQEVAIHGLGEDFSTGLLDGAEQATTSEDRGIHFSQYPPGMFKTIKVYLNPRADLIGQGLAGTVDMETWRPLQVSHREASINASYRWVSPGDQMPGPGVSDKGYNIDGIYINQFDEHTLGVSLGVDIDALPTKDLHEAPWGYPTDSAGNFVPGGSKNYNYSSLRKRESYFATFEYQPSNAYTTTLDLTYEDYNKVTQRKGIEFPLFWSSATLASVGPATNGFVQSGTYTGVYPVIRNDYNRHKDRVYNAVWKNKFRLADHWTAGIDASLSDARRDYGKLESYSGFGYDGPASNGTIPSATVNFSYAPDGQLLLTSPTNFASSSIVLTDPQGWGAGSGLVQQGFLNQLHNEEYIEHLKLHAEHFFDNGPISSVEVGVDGARHHKNFNIYQAFVVLPGAACGNVITPTCTPTQTASIPGASVTDALGFMGIGPQITYDPNALLANGTDVYFPTTGSNTGPLGPPQWTVKEDDTYGFLQFNIHTSITENVGLRGNFGLQVAHTSQSSQGSRVAPGVAAGGSSQVVLIPMSGGTSFTRYLPSLNLVFSFPDNYDARLGISRTMARPRMSDMSAGANISTSPQYLASTNPNQAYFSGSGGNPALLPTMATNYNLSVEHYFTGRASGYRCTANQGALCEGGATGMIQLSTYYLNLSDYINDAAATLQNFTPYVNSYLTPAEQAALGTPLGTFTEPANQGNGHLYGAQIATNIPLGDISRYLDGFGIQASANLSKSAIVYPGNSAPVPIDGLSKWVEHVGLYYGFRGFEANVGFDSRTAFLGRIFGLSETRQEDMIKAQHYINAQVSYDFYSGPLKGLTLIASGTNLGNEVQETYQNGDPRQVIRWDQYGRTYQVGFSYRL